MNFKSTNYQLQYTIKTHELSLVDLLEICEIKSYEKILTSLGKKKKTIYTRAIKFNVI